MNHSLDYDSRENQNREPRNDVSLLVRLPVHVDDMKHTCACVGGLSLLSYSPNRPPGYMAVRGLRKGDMPLSKGPPLA